MKLYMQSNMGSFIGLYGYTKYQLAQNYIGIAKRVESYFPDLASKFIHTAWSLLNA